MEVPLKSMKYLKKRLVVKYDNKPIKYPFSESDYVIVNNIPMDTLSCVTLQTDLSQTKPKISIIVSTRYLDMLSKYVSIN